VPPELARAAASDAPFAAPSAQAARPAASFAFPADPTAPAASDAGAARTANAPAMRRALIGPEPAVNKAADDRAAKEGRPARPEDPRSPAEPVVADAARQREDLLNAIQTAHPGHERPAEGPAETNLRIDTLATTVHADMARGPDSFTAGTPERAGKVPVVYVDQGLGSAGWKQEFASQITLLVSRREPQAEIRVNPPQLGPVEVRIGLQGDQVSLAFTALQPDTRAAIENALPQLREMFAGNGLALGNASVNAESSQQQSPRGPDQNGMPRVREESSETVPALRRADVRLVDTFA
jgi:flagellar hook-length control protein FliK